MDSRTLGKAPELVLMRKETRSSLRRARIAQAPRLCLPGAVTLQSLAIPSATPRSAHEEDVMGHGSHRQVSPSPWAPAAHRSHFHSPKLSRDTRLHLPPLQPQGRAACPPPSSTGVLRCITGEGETQATERSLATRGEEAESQGWTSRLLPIPQTFPVHHACRRGFPCQPVGVARWREDAFRL